MGGYPPVPRGEKIRQPVHPTPPTPPDRSVVKRALISDIHGNLEALTAVLADIDQRSVGEIYCLGDVIGYGPNPCECLDLVMKRCAVTILGNHDQAALFDPDGFNPMALSAIFWTRDQLDNGPGGASASNARWDFIGELPRQKVDGDVRYVHGSPRDPTNEYVFPEFIFDHRKMELLFGKVERLSFQGHTHLPGVFTDDAEFVSQDQIGDVYRLAGGKAMVNVGSVGQPRDGNSRACYVIQDTDESVIEFRRVEYDRDRTIQKIYDIPDLDNGLGDRLRVGN